MTFEGTDRVKETKMNIFLGKYKSFKMKPNESIIDMFDRFTDFVNVLAFQGRPISSVTVGNFFGYIIVSLLGI